MKYLTREELVKVLEGAATLLERYKRCVQDRAGKGLEPRDALALSHILVVEKAKQTHALVHQFAHTLSQATSNYKTVRAEWSGLDEYIQNVGAAIEFYIGRRLTFYRATIKKFQETAELVKSSKRG